jgi:hypothetical protein
LAGRLPLEADEDADRETGGKNRERTKPEESLYAGEIDCGLAF